MCVNISVDSRRSVISSKELQDLSLISRSMNACLNNVLFFAFLVIAKK